MEPLAGNFITWAKYSALLTALAIGLLAYWAMSRKTDQTTFRTRVNFTLAALTIAIAALYFLIF